MDLSYTRAALAYVSYVCDNLREICPEINDATLWKRLNHFVDILDDDNTLDHVPQAERVKFLKDLDGFCLTMQQKLVQIYPLTSDMVH